MNEQYINLVAAVGPIIIMVSLLVVAVLIGYLTGWFYAKSVFVPVIKNLENEKTALKKKINELKYEVDDLKSNIGKLNSEAIVLQKDKSELEKRIIELEKESS